MHKIDHAVIGYPLYYTHRMHTDQWSSSAVRRYTFLLRESKRIATIMRRGISTTPMRVNRHMILHDFIV